MIMYIYLLSFVFAKYERKVQSLIFKDNDHTICIHINDVFQICHPEKQNPDSIDALVQNILENFLSELSFESFASLTKTSISLLSIRILYQDSSCFFFFYSPELAINVSLKWWKWLKLTFKLWNLSPLRIFRNVYACVWYRLGKQFQKEMEILWVMAEL